MTNAEERPGGTHTPSEKELERYAELVATVRRVFHVLAAAWLFCIIALSAPDSALLAVGNSIELPVVSLKVSYFAFFVFAPSILIGLLIYLHVFLGELLELSVHWDPEERWGHALFVLKSRLAVALTWLLFYWSTPAVLAYFAWKAYPLEGLGVFLRWVVYASVLVLLALQFRRRPKGRRIRSGSLLIVIGMGVLVLFPFELFGTSLFKRGFDLSRANMTSVNLRGVDLSWANLEGATLDSADLREATLYGANLKNATLIGANLQGAVLREAIFEGYQIRYADNWKLAFYDAGRRRSLHLESISNDQLRKRVLRGEDLSRTSLRNADLSGYDLSHADFSGSDLTGATLGGANLDRARLTTELIDAAQIREARSWKTAIIHDSLLTDLGLEAHHNRRLLDNDLSGYNFTEIDFTGANLAGIDFRGAVFRKCIFTVASNSPSDDAMPKSAPDSMHIDILGLPWSDYPNTNLEGANLQDARFERCYFKIEQLRQSNNWVLAQYDEVTLNDPVLQTDSVFMRLPSDHTARLKFKDLSDYYLAGARLAEADLSGFLLSRTDLTDANLAGADLTGADLRYAQLKNTNLTNAVLSEVDLRFANLDTRSLPTGFLATRDSSNFAGASIIVQSKDTSQFKDKLPTAEQRSVRDDSSADVSYQFTVPDYQHQPREKPVFRIGTMGHVGHGKTELTAALVAFNRSNQLSRSGASNGTRTVQSGSVDQLSSSEAFVQYESDKFRYQHFDAPGHRDFVKNMITRAVQLDGAILVVSVPEGPMPQTRAHILLAAQVGIEQIVCFLNDTSAMADTELLDLVELDVRELLTQYGYPGEDVPIIRGSSSKALEALLDDKSPDSDAVRSIGALLDSCDVYFKAPIPADSKPFLLPVEDAFSVSGRGTIAMGRIKRGQVEADAVVSLVGLGATRDVRVSDVLRFGATAEIGRAGENVELALDEIDQNAIDRGMVLAEPGSISAYDRFNAEIYVLDRTEGGRRTPFFSGFSCEFYFRTIDIDGAIFLPEGIEMVMPGDNLAVSVELEKLVALEQGLRFAIRENGRTIGAGVVTGTIE